MYIIVCLGDFVAKSQKKYFIPLDNITANTNLQAKKACNKKWARLRNVWDESFTIDALKAHFGVVDPTVNEMYSIETGDIQPGLVVCESKITMSKNIMVCYVNALASFHLTFG